MLPRYGYWVTRDRVVPYTDQYGDTVTNFDSESTVSAVYPAHVQVGGASERNDEGREGIVTSATFWFDTNADIKTDDRLRWNNLTWEIDGVPLRWDQLADLAHLEVRAFTIRG